ncbi:MAG: hypothetical protein AAB353_03635 [Candidatus Hydrogenedentota bacterium]
MPKKQHAEPKLTLRSDSGEKFCCLCGELISLKPSSPGDRLTNDHVPPKQFYPKETRSGQNLNLWVIPTHERCNSQYREDEEYFYSASVPFVNKGNHAMWHILHQDLVRRVNKPQTPAMARRLLKEIKTVSDGGIHLPSGIVYLKLEKYRMQRVAIKIAQGRFYLEHKRFLPRQNCKDIRLCETEADVPELYQFSWQVANAKSVLPAVFSYRCFLFEDMHLFSLLFWESFMICAAFENPVAAFA